MHKLTEEEVYNGAKRLLKSAGFLILAGQPPRGVNHLPVIEIKSGKNTKKGSKDAFKPDLLAFKDGRFYLVECKPSYSASDIIKLRSVVDGEERIKSLHAELQQRGLFNKVGWKGAWEEFRQSITLTHAYSGDLVSEKGICHIIVKDVAGNGDIVDL